MENGEVPVDVRNGGQILQMQLVQTCVEYYSVRHLGDFSAPRLTAKETGLQRGWPVLQVPCPPGFLPDISFGRVAHLLTAPPSVASALPNEGIGFPAETRARQSHPCRVGRSQHDFGALKCCGFSSELPVVWCTSHTKSCRSSPF